MVLNIARFTVAEVFEDVVEVSGYCKMCNQVRKYIIKDMTEEGFEELYNNEQLFNHVSLDVLTFIKQQVCERCNK